MDATKLLVSHLSGVEGKVRVSGLVKTFQDPELLSRTFKDFHGLSRHFKDFKNCQGLSVPFLRNSPMSYFVLLWAFNLRYG